MPDDLRSELREMRSEIRSDFAEVRTSLAGLAESQARFGTRLDGQDTALGPLIESVTANTGFRERIGGALKALAIVLALVGGSLVAVGGWMIRTTVVLETEQTQTTARLERVETELRGMREAVKRRME